MKKLILICISLVLAAFSCTKQNAEYVSVISLGASEKVIECPVEYSECEFFVYADKYVNSRDCNPIDYEAAILDNQSWVAFGDNGTAFINKRGSGPLRMHLDANAGLRRSARIVLRAEGRTDTLTVRQEGIYREYIRLVGNYPVVPAEGGTYEAVVETNMLPAFLKISGSAGITDYGMSHNLVTFTVGPSPSRDRRSISITVSAPDGWGETVSGSVTLQQEAGR